MYTADTTINTHANSQCIVSEQNDQTNWLMLVER